MAFIGLLVTFILGFLINVSGLTCTYLKKITDTAPNPSCIGQYQTVCWFGARWFCTFLYDLCQYPAALVIGIMYSMVIIQGLLLNGVIKKKSGFLIPWLFVSFIAIIGLSVNFGYVSWFTDLLFIFITNNMTWRFIFLSKFPLLWLIIYIWISI